MTEKKKILITDGMWQGCITSVQSMGRQGHDVYLVDPHADQSTGKSKYCKGLHVCPAIEDKRAYVDFIIDLLEKESFDLLIPIGDKTVEYLAARKDEITPLTNVILPDYAQVKIADDKCVTAEFARQNGFPIPASYTAQSMENVETIAKEDIFPCIVKMPSETASLGLMIINTPEDFLHFYAREGHIEQYPLIQKFINGDLYGSTAVCHAGEMLNYFMFYIPMRYAAGGAAAYYFSSQDPRLLQITRDMVKRLNWSGFIDFDFLMDEKGEFLLLEINPRLSGGSQFAYKMGVDLPLTYAQLVLENDTRVVTPQYREHRQYRLLLPIEVQYHLKNYRFMHRSFRQIFNIFSKTNINWTDFPLTVSQLKQTWWDCGDIIKKRKFRSEEASLRVYTA